MHDSEMEVVTLGRPHITTVTSIARALAIVVAVGLGVGLALAPPAGAHDDGTTAHLWLDHIKPMKDPGTINVSTNPVDWTKLKGVPTDIADGTDDGVELAGAGLKKSAGIFSVDPTKAQARIKSCPAGQGIKTASQNGAVTCTTGPRGFFQAFPDSETMCNNGCTIGTLVLFPGTWSISAKITAEQTPGEDDLLVLCQLDAGGQSAFGSHYLEDTWGSVTFRMQLVATLTGNVHASLACHDGDIGEVSSSNASIMAIRVSQ